MKKYRASGRVPLVGLIAMLLGTIIASLVVGGLAFAVSHLIYLIVFFSLIMGFIGGGILAWAVRRGKVRSPILAGLFGLIMGLGIIGTVHFLDYYITDRNDYREVVYGKSAQNVSQEQVDKDMNDFLMEQTGSTGFIGDLKFNASRGMTITPTSPSGGSNMDLDEKGTVIYWSIELLAVALICAGLGFAAARQPFNEEADEWYPVPRYVGRADWKSRKDFYKLLKSGDVNGAFKMVNNAPNNGNRVDVVAQYTPSVPQSDVIVTIKETRVNRRRRQTSATKMRGVLSTQEFNDLVRMVSGTQTAQSSVVQFSGAGGSLE
ncbi:MAG: lysostaphin resistance A-like protein [Chloroflexota bacterium]